MSEVRWASGLQAGIEMRHQWYFYKSKFVGEEMVGPVSEEQLLELIRSGKLRRNTKVASGTRTKGRWTFVEAIDRFVVAMEQGKQSRTLEKQRRNSERKRRLEQDRKKHQELARIEKQRALERPSIIRRASLTGTGGLVVCFGCSLIILALSSIQDFTPFAILMAIGGWLVVCGVLHSRWLECSHCGSRIPHQKILVCSRCMGRFSNSAFLDDLSRSAE